MGHDLKAENLTISVPNAGCDTSCPYCVSRITAFIREWLLIRDHVFFAGMEGPS